MDVLCFSCENVKVLRLSVISVNDYFGKLGMMRKLFSMNVVISNVCGCVFSCLLSCLLSWCCCVLCVVMCVVMMLVVIDMSSDGICDVILLLIVRIV